MQDDRHSLLEELKMNPGRTVLIGARSSFFFIGRAEEAIRDIGLVGVMSKLCVQLYTDKPVSEKSIREAACDIGSRKVVRSFIRNVHSGDNELVVIIEGRELGSFWTRDEYVSCARRLLDSVNRNR